MVGKPRSNNRCWDKKAQTLPYNIAKWTKLSYTRIIAAITSKGFKAPYRVDFTLLDKKARILCDQIICVSTERFVEKIADLDVKNISKVKQILKTMFA